jgi:hypothetical protein
MAGDEKAYNFIFGIAFSHAGQIRIPKPATADSPLLPVIVGQPARIKYIDRKNIL